MADYKLIAFDMDSTLINIECIDEIADMLGISEGTSKSQLSRARGLLQQAVKHLESEKRQLTYG